MDTFDVIVIGTGTSGQTAAFELAAEGFKVAIAENSDTPGGVCALRGCQAKKYYYEVAETIARCNHLMQKGISKLPQFSWREILHEKNSFTEKIPQSTRDNIRGNDIAFLDGKAQFVDATTLKIGETLYSGRYIIIASGAQPRELSLEGNQLTITSDDFLELKEIPRRIAFIGGGYISFEFAHFAARLGGMPDNIHVMEVNSRPLGPFDEDMVEQLVKASTADGIKIHTGIDIISFTKSEDGISVNCRSGEKFNVDLVVNSTGRVPRIKALHLETAGIVFNEKGIEVNRSMQTSNSHIFAIGDCADTIKLARVADKEAKIAAAAIQAIEQKKPLPQIDYSAVPAVLFSYPQLAMVGKTEKELQEDGVKYWKSFDTELGWPTYKRVGLQWGAYKILVDENDLVVGAHFISDNTTGLINTFKQAIIDKTPVQNLYDANIMAPYPSRESDIIYMLSQFVE